MQRDIIERYGNRCDCFLCSYYLVLRDYYKQIITVMILPNKN
jgi:hypothetical protein